MRLPSPLLLKRELPLEPRVAISIEKARQACVSILCRDALCLGLLVGPCSIHDTDAALEYAHRLKKLSEEVKNLFFIMRFFFEKPRTRLGWKGILYDPHLDGSNDIAAGLRISRKLLLQVVELGIPCATELLEPLAIPYFDDLISWGVIGARTSASQPHRQLASGLSFPVGFKNDLHGELDVAISGILSSRTPHTFIGIDEHGYASSLRTQGNPLSHLILRGSVTEPNFDATSVAKALRTLQQHHLETRLIIDCSHGNSGKDSQRQIAAFESVIEQVMRGNKAIAGLMLESHLFPGKQPLGDDRSLLRYGVSITDPCLGWDETESLLRLADERLSERSMSMSSVQK